MTDRQTTVARWLRDRLSLAGPEEERAIWRYAARQGVKPDLKALLCEEEKSRG